MHHPVQIAQTLEKGESRGEEGVVDPEDLDHSPGPSDPLTDVGGQGGRGKARRLGKVQIGRLPSFFVETQGGVRILRHRIDRDAADLLEGGASQDGAGSTEGGRIPEVVAVLDDAIKEGSLVRNLMEDIQVSFVGVGRVEMVGSLDEGVAGLFLQDPDGCLEKGAGRDMVAVEYGDVFSGSAGEGVVEIAGLGMAPLGPGEILDSGRIGEIPEGRAIPIVEEIDLELFGGPVQVQCTQDRRPDNGQGFVVGGDEDVHVRPELRLFGKRLGLSLKGRERLEVSEDGDGPGEELGTKQKKDEGIFVSVDARVADAQCLGGPPPPVSACEVEGDEDHRDEHPSSSGKEGSHQKRDQEKGAAQPELGRPVLCGNGHEKKKRRDSGEEKNDFPGKKASGFFGRHGGTYLF